MEKDKNLDKTTVDKKPEPETVTVNREKLEKILSRLERLESAADKARTFKYDNEHKDDQQKVIKLMTYDGKVIEYWDDMPLNRVEKNQNTGAWKEQQVISLHYFGDEKPEEVDYVVFTRNYQKIPTILLEETILKSPEDLKKYGNYKLKVRDFQGNEYIIGSKFVN